MMNKYQEALDFVKKHLDSKQDLEKVEVLQELVDKTTPKKPINRINYRTDINAYYCPNCNGFICNYYDKDNERDDYCCNCGQALDWSDEDVEQRKM